MCTGRASFRRTSGDALEGNGYRRPLANCAIQFDASAMIGYGMFGDGKPKPGSASLFGMALIHPIKALKDARLMLGRDANARIAHG